MAYNNSSSGTIYSDITGFVSVIQSIIESKRKSARQAYINALKSDKDFDFCVH